MASIPDATAVLGEPPWLFVGAQESVARERRDLLVERGVTHIASILRDAPPWLVHGRTSDPPPQFEHLHIKVEDTRAADLSKHFEAVNTFLTCAKAAGGRAVVHCAFGKSRSVAVVAAYLVEREHFSLGEALERIRSRRPVACPNPSFLAQLIRLELAIRPRALSDLRQFPSLPTHWAFVSWKVSPHVTRIACHARIMTVRRISAHPRVASVSNFLTREEAAAIVETATSDLHPSLVVRHAPPEPLLAGDEDAAPPARGGERSPGRTSWNCRVSATHPAVRGAIQRAAYLSGLLPSHAEPAQVVRYLPGQRYEPHFDWFDPTSEKTFAVKTASGGQRVTTTLVYLVEPELGGHTVFPRLRRGFEPVVGEALIWWNVGKDGREDSMTLHAGEPVIRGEKWALNLWLREKPRARGGEGTQ